MTRFQAEIVRAAKRWGLVYIPKYAWVPAHSDWTPAGPSWRDCDIRACSHSFHFLQPFHDPADATVLRCKATKIGRRALLEYETREAYAQHRRQWMEAAE